MIIEQRDDLDYCQKRGGGRGRRKMNIGVAIRRQLPSLARVLIVNWLLFLSTPRHTCSFRLAGQQLRLHRLHRYSLKTTCTANDDSPLTRREDIEEMVRSLYEIGKEQGDWRRVVKTYDEFKGTYRTSSEGDLQEEGEERLRALERITAATMSVLATNRRSREAQALWKHIPAALKSTFLCNEFLRAVASSAPPLSHRAQQHVSSTVQAVLQSMRDEGKTLDKYTYTNALSCLAIAGRWFSAVRLLREIRSAGTDVQPTPHMISAVVSACAAASDGCARPRLALAIVRRHESDAARATRGRRRANGAAAAAAAAAGANLVGETAAAEEEEAEEEAESLEPCDVVAYTSLLRACERASDWSLARRIKDEDMRDRGVVPNGHSFSVLMQTAAGSATTASPGSSPAAGGGAAIKDVLDLLREAEAIDDRGVARPNQVRKAALARDLAADGSGGGGGGRRRPVAAVAPVYGAAIRALTRIASAAPLEQQHAPLASAARKRRREATVAWAGVTAVKLLQRMSSRGVGMGRREANAALQALAVAGDYRRAAALVLKMSDNGNETERRGSHGKLPRPDTVSFNTALAACARALGDDGEQDAIGSSMESDKIWSIVKRIMAAMEQQQQHDYHHHQQQQHHDYQQQPRGRRSSDKRGQIKVAPDSITAGTLLRCLALRRHSGWCNSSSADKLPLELGALALPSPPTATVLPVICEMMKRPTVGRKVSSSAQSSPILPSSSTPWASARPLNELVALRKSNSRARSNTSTTNGLFSFSDDILFQNAYDNDGEIAEIVRFLSVRSKAGLALPRIDDGVMSAAILACERSGDVQGALACLQILHGDGRGESVRRAGTEGGGPPLGMVRERHLSMVMGAVARRSCLERLLRSDRDDDRDYDDRNLRSQSVERLVPALLRVAEQCAAGRGGGGGGGGSSSSSGGGSGGESGDSAEIIGGRPDARTLAAAALAFCTAGDVERAVAVLRLPEGRPPTQLPRSATGHETSGGGGGGLGSADALGGTNLEVQQAAVSEVLRGCVPLPPPSQPPRSSPRATSSGSQLPRGPVLRVPERAARKPAAEACATNGYAAALVRGLVRNGLMTTRLSSDGNAGSFFVSPTATTAANAAANADVRADPVASSSSVAALSDLVRAYLLHPAESTNRTLSSKPIGTLESPAAELVEAIFSPPPPPSTTTTATTELDRFSGHFQEQRQFDDWVASGGPLSLCRDAVRALYYRPATPTRIIDTPHATAQSDPFGDEKGGGGEFAEGKDGVGTTVVVEVGREEKGKRGKYSSRGKGGAASTLKKGLLASAAPTAAAPPHTPTQELVGGFEAADAIYAAAVSSGAVSHWTQDIAWDDSSPLETFPSSLYAEPSKNEMDESSAAGAMSLPTAMEGTTSIENGEPDDETDGGNARGGTMATKPMATKPMATTTSSRSRPWSSIRRDGKAEAEAASPVELAATRRLRALPAVDLHGFSRPMAHVAIRAALQEHVASWRSDAAAKEFETAQPCSDLVIITGRGKNSVTRLEPILRPEVQRMLVDEFYPPLSSWTLGSSSSSLPNPLVVKVGSVASYEKRTTEMKSTSLLHEEKGKKEKAEGPQNTSLYHERKISPKKKKDGENAAELLLLEYESSSPYNTGRLVVDGTAIQAWAEEMAASKAALMGRLRDVLAAKLRVSQYDGSGPFNASDGYADRLQTEEK